MRENNIVGCSRGYVERVERSCDEMTPERVQKYMGTVLRYVSLYESGETGDSVGQAMAIARKKHRRPVDLEVDHKLKRYNRNRY